MDEMLDAPDPLDTVTLLKSDFDLLQAAAHAAMADYEVLCELLGITPVPGRAPREVMHTQVLPMIGFLLTEKVRVDQASEAVGELVNAAKARGGTEITLGDGRKAVLAGRKNPQLLAGVQPLSRRERRQFDRELGR